jgi:hypothetical protein
MLPSLKRFQAYPMNGRSAIGTRAGYLSTGAPPHDFRRRGMDEPQRWTCECGYSVAVTEDEMADLRTWARHVRNAHGEDVLESVIQRELDRRAEELKREGKVLHGPFDRHD